MNRLTVHYHGHQLSTSQVNKRMEDADPGTWGLDNTLVWSCPIMAGYAADNARLTFGPRYTVVMEQS